MRQPLGKDGAASTLVIAVGEPGNCIIRATSGTKIVGVLAEVVEATAAPTETAPPDVDEEPTAEMVVGFMGELPTSGFASVTFTGSVEDLKAALATACPAARRSSAAWLSMAWDRWSRTSRRPR